VINVLISFVSDSVRPNVSDKYNRQIEIEKTELGLSKFYEGFWLRIYWDVFLLYDFRFIFDWRSCVKDNKVKKIFTNGYAGRRLCCFKLFHG
jgi:hypothetical protein